jgi:hypothetical protein
VESLYGSTKTFVWPKDEAEAKELAADIKSIYE